MGNGGDVTSDAMCNKYGRDGERKERWGRGSCDAEVDEGVGMGDMWREYEKLRMRRDDGGVNKWWMKSSNNWLRKKEETNHVIDPEVLLSLFLLSSFRREGTTHPEAYSNMNPQLPEIRSIEIHLVQPIPPPRPQSQRLLARLPLV
jgi:hypothetical protein